jgi:hypothetical protein
MKNSVFVFVFIFSCVFASAQTLIREDRVHVVDGGLLLENAWAGGLNSPQFSELDLDLDGLMDLFVFDRSGDRFLTFLMNSDGTYKHTRAFDDAFFMSMHNFVSARDMNCDGKNDLLVNVQNGVEVYLNVSTEEAGLEFEQMLFPSTSNLLPALYAFNNSPFTSPIYTVSMDVPSFVDYDDDGDIDVFSYTEYATTVYFYKNMAVENGNCAEPSFICANRCYGMFSESPESFAIFTGLDAECEFNVVDPRSAEQRALHTGGLVLNIDLDQNGIKDLIASDVSEPNMAAFLMEDAVDGQDSVTVTHFNFPQPFGESDPVHLVLFPAGYYLDVTNDGVKDLLVAPNVVSDGEDLNSVLFYRNDGLDDLPSFQYVTNDFLQHGMIDAGINAMPVFFDENNDGLLDLIVANRKAFSLTNTYTSRFTLYRNVGDAEVPSFELVNNNWLDIPSFNWLNAYPAFGDIDNDGDQDLLVGDQDGFIHVFKNNAGSFTLFQEDLIQSDGNAVDVGQFATPQIVDFDEDGLVDLLIGEKNGNINYYRNMGSSSSYNFTLIEDTIGNAVASNYLGINGYSVPFALKDDNNEWRLWVGNETGTINVFGDIEGNVFGDYTLLEDSFQNIREGERASMHLADITNDGIRDMVYGQNGGGVALFVSEELIISVEENEAESLMEIFPNPVGTDQMLTVVLPQHYPLNNLCTVYDISGRVVATKLILQHRFSFDLDLPTGVYFLRYQSANVKFLIR